MQVSKALADNVSDTFYITKKRSGCYAAQRSALNMLDNKQESTELNCDLRFWGPLFYH